MDAQVAQLRARANAYPMESPECEAFIEASVRHELAESQARTDAVIMRSWRLRRAWEEACMPG